MGDVEKPLNNLSIIGCGDIGCRVAKILQSWAKPDFTGITGYARSAASLARMAQAGIEPARLNLDNLVHRTKTTLTQFNNQLVFYFAPPPARGKADTRIRAWLASLDASQLPRRIVYISTTGVYGDQQGNNVTESTHPQPQTDRGKRRLDAEQVLTEFAYNNAVEFVILRVPGIYGMQRLPRKRIESKTPVLHPQFSPFTNHIHEDDLAHICVVAARHSASGEIYNVSDNDKMTMSDYFIQVADFLKLPHPPVIDWQQAEQVLSAGMLSYLRESRRIDNSKLLRRLKIKLEYPSLTDFFNYNLE